MNAYNRSYVPCKKTPHIFETLHEAGKDLDLKLCGMHMMDSLRIEKAFRKYFFRSPLPDSDVVDSHSSKDGENEKEKHEFEIIICHANVIRYFLCR